MSDKYAALRAAAEAVKETAHIARYTKAMVARQDFKEAATFDVILALLAEREADKARIAQLEAERDALREGEMGDAKHSNTRAAADIYFQLVEECNIQAGGSLVEYVDDLRDRIAELESRKLLVNIRQWDEFTVQHFTSCSDDYAAGWVNGRDHAQDEICKGCAAAGFTLETGE